MGMLDSPSSNRFWKSSFFYAKEDGHFSAEPHVASSSRKYEKQASFSFFRKRWSYHQEEVGMCTHASLRTRALLFFLKARVAAGREMRLLQTWNGSAQDLTLLHFKSSLESAPPSLPGSQFFKKFTPSPVSKGSSSWFLRTLFTRKRRKGSLFIYGAGMGAFALFLLHRASVYATHWPALALSAGSRSLCFLVKIAQKKCANAGSKRAACFMQGIRRALSLFQMGMSLLRSAFIGNPLVLTAMLVILIGMV